jgi:hypothetical protein
MALAIKERRMQVVKKLHALQSLRIKLNLSTKKAISDVLNNLDNDKKINLLIKDMITCFKKEKSNHYLIQEIINNSDQISKKSI